MVVRPRELPGRDVIYSLQQFEWRFQTLKRDGEQLNQIEDPGLDKSATQHRFTNREHLHEAERRLHHFLSGYYTFKCLVTTLAQSVPDPVCTDRLKYRRDNFADKSSSRVILGMRHYVQHHNVLPVLVKNSTFSKSFPRYAINVDDLHMDGNSYRLPQMVIDIGEHNDGYDYFYESVDDICIYPFEIIAENWDDVVDLRDDVYAIVRMTLQEELDEYVEQIRELKRVREELRDEHEIFDDMLQELENEGVLPSMRELLTPEIHDRITEDDCS